MEGFIDVIFFLSEAQLPGTTQDHLQIFNIDAKAKMKSYQMPEQVIAFVVLLPWSFVHQLSTTFVHCSAHAIYH